MKGFQCEWDLGLSLNLISKASRWEMDIFSLGNIVPDSTVQGPKGDLARCVMPGVFQGNTAALCPQEI